MRRLFNRNIDINDVIGVVEDLQDLVLEPNSGRLRDDWETLGYPTTLCKNNPYELALKASEGVRLGLIVVGFLKNGLGG